MTRTDSQIAIETTAAVGSVLEAHLRNRDEPCPRCGYNLRNLRGDRCPECGDELLLRVGLAVPRHGPYLASLVGSGFGAGAGWLMSLVALTQAPSSWWFSVSGVALALLAISGSMLLVGLLRSRRSFSRRSEHVQRRLAAVICGSMLVLAVTVLVFFD